MKNEKSIKNLAGSPAAMADKRQVGAERVRLSGEKMPPVTLSHRRLQGATPVTAALTAPRTTKPHPAGGTVMSKAAAVSTIVNTPTTPRRETRDIKAVWIEY